MHISAPLHQDQTSKPNVMVPKLKIGLRKNMCPLSVQLLVEHCPVHSTGYTSCMKKGLLETASFFLPFVTYSAEFQVAGFVPLRLVFSERCFYSIALIKSLDIYLQGHFMQCIEPNKTRSQSGVAVPHILSHRLCWTLKSFTGGSLT